MCAIRLPIPASNGILEVEIPDQKVLFILGRNGTGKSALVHFLRGKCSELVSGRVIYLPGSRPSYFEGDSLQMTAYSRHQFVQNSRSWDSSPDIRVRPISGTTRNERAIYDLQAAEVQYRVQAAYEIERDGKESLAIARLQSKSSPLDRVNRLFQQANLPVQIVIESGEIKAEREGNVFSISKMSDGERSALVLIADVIAAEPASVLLVDEPELHLHRAIVGPLMSALIVERSDCTMIICTHELALANEHPDSPVILVRSCCWNGSTPSSWEIDLLMTPSEIPEGLRIDLLGSRKCILFVEGTSSSRDQPLYAILFPKASLRYRTSCVDVRRAVVGLRQVEEIHHARAFGLVDNDGMSEQFKAKLLSEGVYALPIFAVESLYYAPEVIHAVAARQASTLGEDRDQLVNAAKQRALSKLREDGKLEHLAARLAERQVRDQLLDRIPSRAAMIESGENALTISVPNTYCEILKRAQGLLKEENLHEIIARFPVRESGILGDIATGLRFIGESDYEKAVRAAVSIDAELANLIKSKLCDLVTQLE